MGQLIDKAVLQKELSKLPSEMGFVRKSDVMQILGRQKCAYNIDKVVKELEETHKRFCNSVVCGGKGNSYLCEDCEEYILVSHYIEAVKDGRTCQ